MKHLTFKSQIKIALVVLTLIICAESKAQLKLIHYWDMNNTLPSTGAGGVNLSPLYAGYSKIANSAFLSFGIPATSYTLDNGTAGSTLNEFHVLGNDTSSTAANNLYIRARSPNTGTVALFSWHLPTTNYENITVSFASELSSAGKGVLSFSYSTNGGTTYSVIPTSCMTPATNPYTPGTTWGVATFNFSTLPAVNNNPNFIIAMTNTVVGATGNYRFDNISVQGDTVQISAQNTSCFRFGNALATPIYGTAPYTYTWTPSGGNAATAMGLSPGNYTVSMTDANGIVATATVAIVLPASPLVANISSFTNVNCFGGNTGSTVASVSGGTPGYTYTWSPSGGNTSTASGLVQGTYTLNVTDANGCTTNTTVTIAQPAAALSASITTSVNGGTCSGGSTNATVTINGGTPSYTYAWSPTGGNSATTNSLMPGTYTVNITDANNCAASSVLTVTAPASALSVGISSFSNLNCATNNTGSVTAVVTGGAPAYTYTWSPSGGNATIATNLGVGTYTIHVKDANSCTTNTTVTITKPVVSISSSANVNCFGNNTGAASATVSGGTAGYTYTWLPSGGNTANASNLTGGTYTISVTDANSCTTNTTVTIAQPAALSTNITSNNVTCFGLSNGTATVAATGGTGTYSYSWSNGQTSPVVTGLSANNPLGLIHYWDMNNTLPAGGAGGTNLSPLNAEYSTFPAGSAYLSLGGASSASYTLDNGSGGSTINEFPVLGNDTSSTAAGNLYIRARNPNQNVPFYFYLPTTNYENVILSFATELSSAGKGVLSYSYSIDGGTTYSLVPTSCLTPSNNPYTPGTTWGKTTVNFSSIPGVNNNPNFIFVATNTLSATGNYRLDNVALQGENMNAATYIATVTDGNGCINTASVTITQPASALTANVSSSTNVSCFNVNTGAASVSVSGGTSGYTYTWSPSGGNTSTANNLAAGNYTVNIADANNCTTNTNITITQPASALNAVITSTNVNCFGNNTGAASVLVSGGTSGYTYTWSPTGGNAATASGLTGGTYTVNIADANNCATNTVVTIAQPSSNLSAVITSTNISCNSSGVATAIVTGGTAGYTYTWSPSGGNAATANDLTAGNYTVNVTDNLGCTASNTVSITQPASSLNALITSTNVACFGNSTGSASATVSGGTAGYTYTWSPSGGNSVTANNLPAGNYTLNVTDSKGCKASNVVAITQPTAALLVSTGTVVNVNCFGNNTGSASVIVSGGTSGYTYTWSPLGGNTATATNLGMGIYTIHVKDANSCTTNTTVAISQPASALNANISASTNVTCNGGSNGSATAAVTGGTSSYTYTWSPSGGNAAIANNLIPGNYTVNVTDANGCAANTTVTIAQPAALSTNITSNNVTCYGLSNGTATVSATGGTGTYTYSWSNGQTSPVATGLSATSNSLQLIHYWDMNNTLPGAVTSGTTTTYGGGGINLSPLNAEYSTFPAGSAYLSLGGASSASYTLDNGSGGSTINEFPVLGNDTSSTAAGNLYIRARNPNQNVPFYFYLPTTNYENVILSFATELSSAGKGVLSYSYSIDGGTTYSLVPTSCLTPSNNPYTPGTTWGKTTVNFSSIPGVNNNPNFIFVATNTLSATGNYRLDNVALQGENMNAATYIATVTDGNGCINTASVTITQPASALTASVSSSTNVTCFNGNNGSATASVSGGNTSYNYTWTPSGGNAATANNLTAGNYTVNVMDNKGCTASNTIAITQPATAPTITVSGGTICSGSSYTLSPSGANTYTFAPNGPVVTPSSTTNYTVTGTDNNGCTGSSVATVAVNTNPTITVNSGTICSGSSYTLSPSGANTYTFAPNGPVVTPSSTTNYTITGADNNGCTGNSVALITVNTSTVALTIGTISGPSSNVCASTGTYSVAAVTGATSYSWTVSANVTITSGQGTNVINVSYGSSFTTGTVSVYAGNQCSNSATKTLVIAKTPAAPASISGLTTNGCIYSSATTTYVATAVTGATSYSWTVPSNATIVSGQGTNTITVNYASSFSTGTISVTDNNACATSSLKSLTVSGAPAVPGTISGPSANVCASTGTYSIAAVAGATSYSWTVSSNISITSGQGTNVINVSYGSSFTTGTVSVYASNQCSNSATKTLAIAKTPAAPASISGPTTNASTYTSTTATYIATAVTGATTYSWTVPSNATIVSGQGTNTITVNYASSFSTGTISVTDNNTCATSSLKSITLSGAPATPGTISGPSANVCASTGTYSVAAVAGATSYSWTVSSNVSITSGQGTNVINVSYGSSFTTGTVSVYAGNQFSNSATKTLDIAKTPAAPASISGPTTNACTYTSDIATYTATAVTGATSYSWTVPSNATIVSGQGTNTITVNYASSFSTGTISVTDNNTCATSSLKSITLSGAPATPGTISGPSANVCASTGTYSVAAVAGATSYSWTVSSNVSITSGQGTNVINVSYGSSFTTGTVSVYAGNQFSNSATKTLDIAKTPAAPASISGPTTNACTYTSDIATYTATAVTGATSYSWTVPSNATIVSGQGTNTITVNYASSFSTGTISVTDNNTCATSSIKNLTVSGAPAVPGTISGQSTDLCGGVTETYSVAAVAGATLYSWTVPSGVSISSGQGTDVINITFPSTFSTGTIYVSTSNSCKNSANQALAVTKLPATPGTISGTTANLCETTETYSIALVTGATSYSWTAPANATITSGQGTNIVTVNFGSTLSSASIKVVSENTCGNSAVKTLTLSNCNAINNGRMMPDEQITPSNFIISELYPNPCDQVFNVDITSDYSSRLSIEIIDATGRIVQNETYQIQVGANTIHANMSNELVNNGIYMIRITDMNSGKIALRRLAVQR